MTFKRGQDPKEAMNIGIANQLEEYIKEEYPRLQHRDYNQLLRICAGDGKLDFVQYLIEIKNADPHNCDEHCLRWAAKMGHLDVVQYFVEEHNADIFLDNNLALRWATDEGHISVANYLKRKMREQENKKTQLKESVSGFQRGLDPKAAMGVGKAYLIPQIKEWLYEKNRDLKYKINPDATIDVLENIRFYNEDIKELPEYINFNIINGNFEFSHSKLF